MTGGAGNTVGGWGVGLGVGVRLDVGVKVGGRVDMWVDVTVGVDITVGVGVTVGRAVDGTVGGTVASAWATSGAVVMTQRLTPVTSAKTTTKVSASEKWFRERRMSSVFLSSSLSRRSGLLYHIRPSLPAMGQWNQ